MNTMMLALLLVAQAPDEPASQPASQPARLQPGGTGADVVGNVTWIMEVDEKVLRVQETWTLTNESGKLVSKEHLVFPLPEGTRRVNLDEDTHGFKAADDASHVAATEALGSGSKQFAGSHMVDFSGSTAIVRRQLPVRLVNARLIVENIQGLEVTSNVQFDKRVRELNGLEFQVVQFAPMNAGSTFELKLDGLPSHTTLPRTAALIVVFGIVGWAVWMLRRPEDGLAAKLGPLSAQARRDRIVKAIEILERDHSEDKIKEKKYERRHEELMTELAAVLREIDLAK